MTNNMAPCSLIYIYIYMYIYIFVYIYIYFFLNTVCICICMRQHDFNMTFVNIQPAYSMEFLRGSCCTCGLPWAPTRQGQRDCSQPPATWVAGVSELYIGSRRAERAVPRCRDTRQKRESYSRLQKQEPECRMGHAAFPSSRTVMFQLYGFYFICFQTQSLGVPSASGLGPVEGAILGHLRFRSEGQFSRNTTQLILRDFFLSAPTVISGLFINCPMGLDMVVSNNVHQCYL